MTWNPYVLGALVLSQAGSVFIILTTMHWLSLRARGDPLAERFYQLWVLNLPKLLWLAYALALGYLWGHVGG